MPSPCSIPLSSDSPSADPALSLRADTEALGTSEQPAGSFDDVLADCKGETPASPTETSTDAKIGAPLTAEQLAYLAAFVLPQPAAQPAPVGLTVDPAKEVSLARVNGDEESLQQALAKGAPELHYRLAGDAKTPSHSSSGAAEEAAPFAEAEEQQGGANANGAAASTPSPTEPEKKTAAGKHSTQPKHPPGEPVNSAAASISAPAQPPAKTPQPNSVTAAAAATTSAVDAPAAPSPVESASAVLPNAQQAAASQAHQTGENAAVSSSRIPVLRGAPKKLPEKIAASSDQVPPSGVMPSVDDIKNNKLLTGEQQLSSSKETVGTRAANWGDPMPFNPRFSELPAFAPEASAASAFRMSAAATTTFPTETARAPEAVSQAAAMVSEIREIAEGLWTVERNSVEVKFDFGADDRLAVKVEYRDGVIHATFRSDNREIREAISREWSSQNSSSENRNYRFADPVFSSSGFSSGQDSARQQQQQQRATEERNSFERAAALSFRGFSSASPSNSSASAPAPTSRSENSGYLNAIV